MGFCPVGFCPDTYFTLVGVVSSDISRSSCTTSFPPCCSIFSPSHVFFQGCPCPFIDVINVLHPRTPLLLFPDIIPRMQVFTRLHSWWRCVGCEVRFRRSLQITLLATNSTDKMDTNDHNWYNTTTAHN